MISFRGQAGWAKMTSLGGKLTALACHPTKKVNKAEGAKRSLFIHCAPPLSVACIVKLL
jgi:hypothetical protein